MAGISMHFDFKQINDMALRLGAAADQVPYAVALALNRSADTTRNFLIKATWPGAIKQRNASFIAASLTTKGARANKRSCSVEIYDRLNRGNLKMQALGGTRTPRRGNYLAIPAGSIKRGAHGVPARFRPKTLKGKAVELKGLLFARDGKGRLKLVYTLKTATRIPKRVPFYQDFEASMRRELQRNIPLAIKQAMATRR